MTDLGNIGFCCCPGLATSTSNNIQQCPSRRPTMFGFVALVWLVSAMVRWFGQGFRGSKIVIPESIQKKTVDIAHESHHGICKTKALLRGKAWFSKIDELVKTTLESSLACQALRKAASTNQFDLKVCQKHHGTCYMLILLDHSHRVNTC